MRVVSLEWWGWMGEEEGGNDIPYAHKRNLLPRI